MDFLRANMALSSFVIIGIVLCVTQPITIIANLLTIIAFMKVPSLQTHTSNLLIFALSIADFISGVYHLWYDAIPLAFGLKPPFGEIGCMMTVPLEYFYTTGNFLLVAISIDRVLLVSMDYSKYVKIVTKSRLKLTMGICLLICQIPTVLVLSLWNYAKKNNANAASIDFEETCLYPIDRIKSFSVYQVVCFFYLPLCLVGIFSIIFIKRLLIRIHSNRRVIPENRIPDNNVRSAGENQDEIAHPTASEETTQDHKATIKKRYIKPALTLIALVSAMGISMVPYNTYCIVEVVTGTLNANVSYAMYFTLQLNPLLDPLFFAATQKGIREFYGSKIRAMSRTFAAFRNPN